MLPAPSFRRLRAKSEIVVKLAKVVLSGCEELFCPAFREAWANMKGLSLEKYAFATGFCRLLRGLGLYMGQVA